MWTIMGILTCRRYHTWSIRHSTSIVLLQLMSIIILSSRLLFVWICPLMPRSLLKLGRLAMLKSIIVIIMFIQSTLCYQNVWILDYEVVSWTNCKFKHGWWGNITRLDSVDLGLKLLLHEMCGVFVCMFHNLTLISKQFV